MKTINKRCIFIYNYESNIMITNHLEFLKLCFLLINQTPFYLKNEKESLAEADLEW